MSVIMRYRRLRSCYRRSREVIKTNNIKTPQQLCLSYCGVCFGRFYALAFLILDAINSGRYIINITIGKRIGKPQR